MEAKYSADAEANPQCERSSPLHDYVAIDYTKVGAMRIEKYAQDTKKWAHFGNIPKKRHYFGAELHGSKLIVFGGHSIYGTLNTVNI